jgi:hypothetical protein
MVTATRRPGWSLVIPATVILLLGFLYLAVAAPYLSSRQEEMMLDRVPVTVTYSDSASPDDLKMQFYPGAVVEKSFAYDVSAKDGQRAVEYASATLTTPDSWKKVAEYYAAELPGHPTAEAVEGESGERYVLAASSEEEVRAVTVIPTDEGCRIELVRATHPKIPAKPVKPRPDESVI